MSKTGLLIMDDLLRKSSKEVLKVILHVCLVVCNYLYLQTLDCLTILYIALGHFHFIPMEYIFSCKKKKNMYQCVQFHRLTKIYSFVARCNIYGETMLWNM